ncbi:MAG: 50S ribosomal protein L18 [candidate division Zixibacteria bacterium]|nr:50S ribosomal protein L18 [candidate division Zixibacteria bacterium]
MADKNIQKAKRAMRRRRKVRGIVSGTADRPRLTVCKSLNNMFAQIIDDEKAVTLVAASSNSKNVAEHIEADKNKSQVAFKVGEIIAAEAKAKGIETVVFDRNRHAYHGRIKALADGARKGGLKF